MRAARLPSGLQPLQRSTRLSDVPNAIVAFADSQLRPAPPRFSPSHSSRAARSRPTRLASLLPATLPPNAHPPG
jgi:hypothetical protein